MIPDNQESKNAMNNVGAGLAIDLALIVVVSVGIQRKKNLENGED